MKNSEEIIAEKYLMMFKADAMNLFSRILYRKPEYITIFALKRTREHFEDVFRNRYRDVTMQEIAHCNKETIEALNIFYEETESIRWYLSTTEDMPNRVSDELDRKFVNLETFHNNLIIQIDSELGIESDIEYGTVKELSFQEQESESEFAETSESYEEFEAQELTDFNGDDDSTSFRDVNDSTDS